MSWEVLMLLCTWNLWSVPLKTFPSLDHCGSSSSPLCLVMYYTPTPQPALSFPCFRACAVWRRATKWFWPGYYCQSPAADRRSVQHGFWKGFLTGSSWSTHGEGKGYLIPPGPGLLFVCRPACSSSCIGGQQKPREECTLCCRSQRCLREKNVAASSLPAGPAQFFAFIHVSDLSQLFSSLPKELIPRTWHCRLTCHCRRSDAV